MRSDELNDVLSLLVMTILADKRVFSSEVKTFMAVASKLNATLNPPIKLSEAKLLSWFETNRSHLWETFRGLHFEDWLKGCLRRLGHVTGKQDILNLMQELAQADDEFHVSETALIVLTAKEWSLPVPPARP